MQPEKPYISVVIATYNRVSLLSRAVESILTQSINDLELIIIDNASSDRTSEFLDDLVREDKRSRIFRMRENIGPGLARNYGIEMACGRYIAIMDDDDIAFHHRLEVQGNYLDSHPSIGVIFSTIGWINDDLKIFNIFPGIVQKGEFPKENKEIFKLLYLESNKIPNPTIMFRSQTLGSLFRYPSFTWIGEDWFLCLQMVASGIKTGAISEPLVLARRDKNQESLMTDKAKAFSAQRRVLKMIRLWLKEKGIHDFDRFHRLAFSNQLVREARYWGAFKGLFLCYQALLISPNNSFAWSTMKWLHQNGWQKVKRKL